MSIVIGLAGKAGSGKDTAGEYLCKMFGFYRIAFGDFLKKHCVDVHGWNGEKDDVGRELLQKEGTNKHREAYENVWVDHAVILIRTLETDGFDKFVITDMRFPNEYNLVSSYTNGYPVRLFGRKYNMSAEAEAHVSETALDNHDFEYKIDSSGNIGEFHCEIYNFLRKYDILGENL